MTRKWLHSMALVLTVALLSVGLVAGPGAQPVQAVGGSYTIVYKAADPLDYIPPIPYPGSVTPPAGGRADGDLLIPGAEFGSGIKSLNPRVMALCQIVPFEIQISVSGLTTPENGAITFVAGWNIDTTNNDAFGYDPDYGVYAAFVDTGDNAHIDPGADATVSDYTWAVVGDEIQGTFNLTGLDDGDVVVVEVWLVLDCTLPPKVGGNVQSRLISAQTSLGDTITLGNQTVPLNQVSQFEAAQIDLAVVKDDDDAWKAVDEPFAYTLTVSYTLGTYTDVANGVTVIDTLDPWLDYSDEYTIAPNLDGLRTCAWQDDDADGLGGTVTCDLAAMSPGDVVTVEFWVKAVSGVPLGSLCEDEGDNTSCSACPASGTAGIGEPDVCNEVEVTTTIGTDEDTTNNWDDEPKDIKYPTPVTLVSFTATGLADAIQLDWETSNEVDNLGFNLYRAPSLHGNRTKLNDALIPTLQPPGSLEGAVYQYIDTTVPGMATYYYWLEDVDIKGYTELHGPVSAQKLK